MTHRVALWLAGISAATVAILALTAWLRPVAALNLIAGAAGGYRLQADIAYGEHERQSLDLYRPAGGPASSPLVVFFYGGAWEGGEKADYRFVGAALAARGFTVAIADYRVYPEVRFPDFLSDGARAVAFVRREVGASRPLVLMGHSAGAHIAAMLALDPQWLGAFGLDPAEDVNALVGLSGPYDFLPLTSPRLKTIFGPEEKLAATQPISFVTGAAPRSFLATGRHDTTVDPGNTKRLAARIRSQGVCVESRIYDRLNHQTILGAFAAPLRPIAPVLDDIVTFIGR